MQGPMGYRISMERKPKMSEHYIRLGMSLDLKGQIEAWRAEEQARMGTVPSFSEACRRLIVEGLDRPEQKVSS